MVGRDNLLHQGQAGATALSLGGGAALKEPAPQVGRDSGTGVLNTEQKPAFILADTDSNLFGAAQRLVESLDGVFNQALGGSQGLSSRRTLS